MAASTLSDWLLQRLDREAAEPTYRQLHALLLQAVLQGHLAAGAKLPSSRLLAHELGVARNTVIDVYENLIAQGCLHSSRGSGTYVADLSSDQLVQPSAARSPQAKAPPRPASAGPASLSRRGRGLVAGAGVSARQWGAFMPGVPDVTEFPVRLWSRLQARHWRRPSPGQLSYAPAGGLPVLRQALAEHLRSARSVQCEAGQVIVTSGSHQAVDLAARLLADAGDHAWLEDPCYWGWRSTLLSLGLRVHAVPGDNEGLRGCGGRERPVPRLVLATPSHQYPLGMVMSVARRQALLEFCRDHGSWIIEDDYDSEFRYGTRPIASLQGLDSSERVVYVGSFSKTLFPGLRVGYLVVPRGLAPAFAQASAELYREGQLQQQAVLADFIAEGHLASHIRRMRKLYAARRQCLLEAIRARFGETLAVSGDNAGLHLVLHLPAGTDDVALTDAALAAGIAVRPLSRYHANPRRAPRGLLLGYACVPEEAMAPAFATLAAVIDRFVPG